MPINLATVHDVMRQHSFKIFGARDYDMNVVGIRRMPGRPNEFDDLMTLSYKENGSWRFHAWACTTDPGGKYLGKPMNPSIGTAVLKSPDQFPGSHKLGVHGASKSWAHEALVQVGVLRVWHDNNRDNIVDYGLAETTSHGTSGINIHRDLGDFSAGCQVFAKRNEHTDFVNICKKQVLAGLGDRFTYTLLEWPADDFVVG